MKEFVGFEKELREGSGLLPEKSLVAWTVARAQGIGALGERVPLVDLGEATVAALRDAR